MALAREQAAKTQLMMRLVLVAVAVALMVELVVLQMLELSTALKVTLQVVAPELVRARLTQQLAVVVLLAQVVQTAEMETQEV
jgi:hypothetical protein